MNPDNPVYPPKQTPPKAEEIGIPDFFRRNMDAVDMGILADRAAIVYERGDEIRSIVGTIIQPNDVQAAELPDMIWVLPHRDEMGRPLQTAEKAQLLQINRKYVIEIGSVVTKEDFA